jgi:CRISPR-associated endonuclease/helicase Cas3
MSCAVLWAKKSKEDRAWLPLTDHLSDTAAVAERLWSEWVPKGVKKAIARSLGGDENAAKRLFLFLAAAHDIGKATPCAQAAGFVGSPLDEELYEALLAAGFNVKRKRGDYVGSTHHSLASQLLLENAQSLGLHGSNLNKAAASILGAHHGKPQDTEYRDALNGHKINFGCDKSDSSAWAQAQKELIQLALELSGFESLGDIPAPDMAAQVLLAGLVIMADWLASNTKYFPLIDYDGYVRINTKERIDSAWDKLHIPKAWEPSFTRDDDGIYPARFGFDTPNAMQKAALKAAREAKVPGLMVIEAPMGSGKTEAALAVSEVWATRQACERGGVYFALPTQATSNGIFPRLLKWMRALDFDDEGHSVNLAHGKAQFNEKFTGLDFLNCDSDVSGEEDTGETAAFVHPWFKGKKQAILADFVAGTIDQVLLMALKQKHVMLRHLGLANKVVIIDECHAYDAYMGQYLKMALRWLGAYGVPVIVLSATLPSDTRRAVIAAYLGDEKLTGAWAQSRDYPLITYTDDLEVKQTAMKPEVGGGKTVHTERLATEELAPTLLRLLEGGGCAGVIMDTVNRAQDAARELREIFGQERVKLIHSRFIAPERAAKEAELLKILGKDGDKRPKNGEKLIVVGTQVLEQSLDIDFDVLVTDIAPMDLLLQRMGRLHRHRRPRPEALRQARCFVTGFEGDGFEKNIDAVYSEYLLRRTAELLGATGGLVRLPEDISELVQETYRADTPETEFKEKWVREIKKQEDDAKAFRLRKPGMSRRDTLVNFLNTDVKDDPRGKKGEAAVRYGDESIEVLVVKKRGGSFELMDGTVLPYGKLSEEQAKEVARQSVNLPPALCKIWLIDKTIDELERSTLENVGAWLDSRWLKEELFLVLDEDNNAELLDFELRYTLEEGLEVTK